MCIRDRRFVLASDLGVVLGVDAGDNHVAVTVSDLLDRTLVHHRTDIDSTESAAARRAPVLGQMEQALTEAGVSKDDILAICVGVAAPVNRAGVSPPHPDGFWERTNPGLADALADWAPAVEIKNDAQLAAIAEGSVGAAVGCRDYVALLAGEQRDVVPASHCGPDRALGDSGELSVVLDLDGRRPVGQCVGEARVRALPEAVGMRGRDPCAIHRSGDADADREDVILRDTRLGEGLLHLAEHRRAPRRRRFGRVDVRAVVHECAVEQIGDGDGDMVVTGIHAEHDTEIGCQHEASVSYTHLTLPTIYSV